MKKSVQICETYEQINCMTTSIVNNNLERKTKTSEYAKALLCT